MNNQFSYQNIKQNLGNNQQKQRFRQIIEIQDHHTDKVRKFMLQIDSQFQQNHNLKQKTQQGECSQNILSKCKNTLQNNNKSHYFTRFKMPSELAILMLFLLIIVGSMIFCFHYDQLTIQNQQKFGALVGYQICLSNIGKILMQKGHLYQFRIPFTQFLSKSGQNTFLYSSLYQITQIKYKEALNLIGLIHNADKNGNINLENNQICQNPQTVKNKLQSYLESQKDRFNQKYVIDKYKNRQLRFCIVINSYNNGNSGLIYRNLDSIFQQDYQNYHIVYTDDHSTDSTVKLVKQYIQENKIPAERFKLKASTVNLGMMENIYNAITNDCQQGEIVVMVDGDDSLIGRNVLSLLNAIYQKEGLALVWSNFLIITGNQKASLGFSKDYDQHQKQQRSYRNNKNLHSSHLKTFFVDLFKKIKIQDLQDSQNKFYRGASDTAMMLPMIEMAAKRMKYLPQILYQYRYDTGQVGNVVNRRPQQKAIKKIFSSIPYEQLNDFSFVDNAFLKLFNQNGIHIKTNQQIN